MSSLDRTAPPQTTVTSAGGRTALRAIPHMLSSGRLGRIQSRKDRFGKDPNHGDVPVGLIPFLAVLLDIAP